MRGICHCCHAVLPDDSAALKHGDDERPLYCSRCGAPQIMMPEYLRADIDSGLAAQTTGMVPPPRPQLVDWQAAVLCAIPVAAVAGVLTALAEVAPQTGFLDTLCVLVGSGVVLGLYRARRPLARVDGKVGLRVGVLTGLLMITAIVLCLSATAVVARFALHGMSGFDADLARSRELGIQLGDQVLAGSLDDATRNTIRQEQMSMLASPEIRAGMVLFQVTLLSGFVLMLTTLGGGFAGILQGRRRALRSRE